MARFLMPRAEGINGKADDTIRLPSERRKPDPLMSDTRRIDIDGPEVDMDDAQRLLYQGELFTGEAAEYMAGELVSLDHYTDGVQDGLSRGWYLDGTVRSEGRSREGFPCGEFKEWHANGVLASRQVFGDDRLTLLEEFKWDENGQPTRSWRLGNG